MSGYLFGDCGCCRGSLVSEEQVVFAAMLYPIGNARIKTADEYGVVSLPGGSYGGMVGHAGNAISERSYLGYGQEYTHSDGTVVYATTVLLNKYDGLADQQSNIDIRSEKPFDGDGDIIKSNPSDTELLLTYANGAKLRWFVTDPYEYAEAVAEAVDMLKTVALLDHLPTYTSWMDGKEFHFCYPSEGAAYGYTQNITFNGSTLLSFFNGAGPHFLSRVYLTWQTQRDYLGAPTFGYGPITSQAIVCAPNSQADGQPPAPVHALAVNGSAYLNAGANYNGYVWATKSAIRTPYNLTRRGDQLLDVITRKFPTFAVVYQPANIPAGETILLPGDVPGYGQSFWDASALPGLP